MIISRHSLEFKRMRLFISITFFEFSSLSKTEGQIQMEVFLMQNTNYVTIYEEYQHKFFQLPQVFFVSEKYKDMSNNAKVAWAILRDRSSLSRKNKWFDSDTGRIYFIFKNDELMKMLNINSEATLVKVKKELVSAGLIEQHRQGFNRPNKMYLLYPEVVMDDIYRIDEFENYTTRPDGTVIPNNNENDSSLEPQGPLKNEAPKNEVPELQKMKPSNTESSNTEILKDLDTKDTKDTRSDSSEKLNNHDAERKRKREEYMNKAYRNNTYKIPAEISDVLNIFCDTDEQRDEYYKVMIVALKNAEKAIGRSLSFETELPLATDVAQAFVRAIRKIDKNKNVGNPSGYIYKSVHDVIVENYKVDQTLSIDEANRSESPIFYNWLENSN